MMSDGQTSMQAFKSLSREEQIESLFVIVQSVRNDQANDKKEHIDMRVDVSYVKSELQGIRKRRNQSDKTLTTSDKIMAVLDRRFDAWAWFRDKVLPQVVTVITFGILYMVFGGKLP